MSFKFEERDSDSTTVGVYRTSATVAGGRRFSFSAREKPRLGRKGKGWAGSIAMGVSTANSWFRNSGSSRSRSVLVIRPASTTSMPTPFSSLRSLRQRRCCSAIRALAA